MIQPDVLVVLFDPHLNGTPGSTNVNCTVFAGDAVDPSCFHAKVILDGPKETDNLPSWEAYSFNVMSY